jgi:hypothetical protein
MRPSVAPTLAIAALALGLGACGGGSAKEKTLSKPQLATQAGAICQNYKDRIDAIPQPAGQSGAQAALAYYEQTRPVLDETVAKLAALKPAAAVKADWTSYVNSQRKASQLLGDLVTQVKSGNKDVQSILTQITKTVDDGDTAAKRIGANACVAATSSPS